MARSKTAELGGGKDFRGVLKGSLECRIPLLAKLVSPFLLGFVLLLFTLELLAAFFGSTFFFGLVLLSALLVFGFALCGFFWGFLLGGGSDDGDRVLLLLLGLTYGCAGVVYRAVIVGANGEGGSYALAVDDDGGPGSLAGCNRLSVGLSVCSISRKWPRCTAPDLFSFGLR